MKRHKPDSERVRKKYHVLASPGTEGEEDGRYIKT